MVRFPPMISAKALGALPQFALGELGEKGLARALDNACLPYQFLDRRDGYITEASLASFIADVARQVGHENLGLLFEPILTVRDYGLWGGYVLSAPTLRQALYRSIEVISLHASNDRVWIEYDEEFVRFSYQFGLRGHFGYQNIAFAAIAVVMSIPKYYIGSNWQAAGLELDFAKPAGSLEIEETYGCPVLYDASNLTIILRSDALAARRLNTQNSRLITPWDIARERSGGPPRNYADAVCEVVRLQLFDQKICVERTAQILETGVRTLQRRLNQDGLTFRDLTNRIMTERSIELLHLRDQSITSISNAVGYSNPNNFSRAFKTQTGLSPRAYRKTIVR